MKNIAWAALLLGTMAACQSGPQFHLTGEVSQAEGKTLYLEASTLDGVQQLDSVRLKADGRFDFAQPRPEAPDFFRLRLDDQVINLSVDSTETIRITAPSKDFATAYTVEGSDNSRRIQELTLKQGQLQAQVNELARAFQAGSLTHRRLNDSVLVLVERYKDEVKRNYIFAAPQQTSSYFALFQRLNNALIFDPLGSKEDVKCFAAVATSLSNSYPNSLRTKNLYNIAIKGMKNTREPRTENLEIPEEKIVETGLINIALKDPRGEVRNLSGLKGKVVILDFTVHQSPNGSSHNLLLRELYDKYAARGLEIFQVSLDSDEHFWKTSAVNLPWICVRDANGIYSSHARVYNVQQLPTLFLINRNNELSLRDAEIKNIDAAIESLL